MGEPEKYDIIRDMVFKRGKNFTLVEVLIALAVTGIAAMGIFRLQVIGIEAALHSELGTLAAELAESKIEEAIARARSESEAPQPASGEIDIEGVNVRFRWQLLVEESIEAPGIPNTAELLRLRRLSCRVNWGIAGSERSFELKRYVWDYDFEM